MHEAQIPPRNGAGGLPVCPNCQSTMSLSRIVPDKADHETQTFKCHRCETEVSELVKYK
jgi:transposase-like protein